MPDGVTIRPLAKDDRVEWARMRTALWPDQTDADMQDWAARREAVTLVAVRPAGGLCGFAEVGERPWAEGADRGPVGYLEGWWVDPDARRMGIGAALVAAAERWVAARGLRHFCSDAEPDNSASLEAHARLGFREVGRAVQFWKPVTAMAPSAGRPGGSPGTPVTVITGASSGIGAELARQLAPAGHRLVLVSRGGAGLGEVARSCGSAALAVTADMTRRADVRRVVTSALDRFGHVDAWVNNVGRGITRPVSALTDEDLDAMMAVNVRSALYGMQEILPHFRERGTGHIVNVSSLLGRVAYVPYRSAYSAAKHFLDALTTAFRDELAESDPGIAVSIVSPGAVRTAFGANALHGGPRSEALPNAQDVTEVAAVIAGMLRTRAPDMYTRAGARAMVLDWYATHGRDP